MRRRKFLSAAVLPLAACRPKTASGFPGYAFVACAADGFIAVVDLATFKVAKQINVGAAPTAVLADRRRRVVYVLTPSTGTVHQISANSLRVERQAAVGGPAYSMALTPPDSPGERLWVLNREQQQIAGIDLSSFQVNQRLTLPAPPVDFDAANWQPMLAVSYGAKGTVGVIDWQSGKQQEGTIGSEVGTVRFQSNGAQILAANLGEQSLAILRTNDAQLITTLPLALRPEQFCAKPDGGEWYISGPGADAVVLVDPYKTQISATLLAGGTPGYLASCYNPFYLFVANTRARSVTVLDIDVRKAIAVAEVGGEPSCIVITPDNQYALILNRESGDVAVLDIPTLRANRNKRASLLTVVPVGARPVSAAVQWRG